MSGELATDRDVLLSVFMAVYLDGKSLARAIELHYPRSRRTFYNQRTEQPQLFADAETEAQSLAGTVRAQLVEQQTRSRVLVQAQIDALIADEARPQIERVIAILRDQNPTLRDRLSALRLLRDFAQNGFLITRERAAAVSPIPPKRAVMAFDPYGTSDDIIIRAPAGSQIQVTTPDVIDSSQLGVGDS